MGWDDCRVKQGVVSILSGSEVENGRHRERLDNELEKNYSRIEEAD